jgi:FkbM family methyltransferase
MGRRWAFVGHWRDGTLTQRLLRELSVRRTAFRVQRTDARAAAALRELDAVAGRNELVTIPIGDGVVMRVAADDELARLICSGEYERSERQFAVDYLRRGDVFIDVGANAGLYTLLAAKAVGPHGAVHAFEPGSTPFGLLETSVRINGFSWITCNRAGLSNTRERRDLLSAADPLGAYSSLGKPMNAGAISRENIELRTLDEFLREKDLFGHVAMVKIDVEGWERRVLEGGRTALVRPDAPVLQVEFADSTAVNAGSSSNDVYETLREFGFTMFSIDTASGFLLHDPKRVKYTYLNLIAAKVPSPLPKAWVAGCSPGQLRSAVSDARRAARVAAGSLSAVP